MTENTLIVLEDKSVANIQFNFEELKAWALAKVEKYQNLTITEEQVIDIKKRWQTLTNTPKKLMQSVKSLKNNTRLALIRFLPRFWK